LIERKLTNCVNFIPITCTYVWEGKITSEPEVVALELAHTFGFTPEEMLFISAKEGTGVGELLERIVERIPPPKGDPASLLRALVFDAAYDPYKGVVAYVRLVDGAVHTTDRIRLMAAGTDAEALEVGIFRPQMTQVAGLSAGEVGYIATGLKSLGQVPVGDTVTLRGQPAEKPLPGYRPLKPMVFAGLYPSDGESYQQLRDALEKLQLNDAALSFQPESSVALGFGFRCGFLGLLHMDIVQERLEREYSLDLLTTAPSVGYRAILTDGTEISVNNPSQMPASQYVQQVLEPWLDVSIVTPSRFIGAMMELATNRRGEFRRMEYLQSGEMVNAQEGGSPNNDPRVLVEFHMPLAEVLLDFNDQLKSRSQGYASMDYAPLDYRASALARLDIMVNNQPVDALSLIIPRDKAQSQGRALVEKLKELIPRQLFEVPIQASLNGKIIARETVRAMRKNVLAKCYGGDITRKRKLLEKQAEGKKRMKRIGHVEVPQEAFLALLKMER
jgi:GTP-binding protein LepA